MVNLKQRLSEGDISLFLRRSRTSHKPLTQSKSCPVKTDSVTKVVKDTIGMIAESEKEVEYAAREVEYLIRFVRIIVPQGQRSDLLAGGRRELLRCLRREAVPRVAWGPSGAGSALRERLIRTIRQPLRI